MAKAFNVEIKGLKQLQAKFQKMPVKLKREIQGELESFGQSVAGDAKRTAPTNVGGLRQSIMWTKSKDLEVLIQANAKYAHIVEFGSKSKVKVPAEFANYALQFKGMPNGGDFKEFVSQIEKWVKRKGIGATYKVATRRKNRQTKSELSGIAWAIAVSIAKKGVEPQPFLIPAYYKHQPKLLSNIERVINNLD